MHRTSKPNERWCFYFDSFCSSVSLNFYNFLLFVRIKRHKFSLFGQMFFFEFSEKMSNCFFNEIDCKKYSKFFTAEFIEKNLENFCQSISLKKKIQHFFKKFEQKKFCHKTKRGSQGEFRTIVPGKSDITLDFDITK